MTIMRYVVAVVLLCTLLTASVVAQNQVGEKEKEEFRSPYFGLLAAMNLAMHSSDMKLSGIPSCCPQDGSATGTGLALGLFYEDYLSQDIRWQFRAQYTMNPGEMVVEESLGNSPSDVRNADGTASSEFVTANHVINATAIDVLEFQPAVLMYLSDNLHVRGGLNIGMVMSSSVEHYEEMINPGLVFVDENDNQSTTRNDYEGEIPEASSLLLFASVGAGYDVQIGEDTWLTPHVEYNIPFSSITPSPDSWTISSMRAGVALKLPVSSPELPIIMDTLYIRDTTVVPVIGLERRSIDMVSNYDENSWEEIETEHSIIKRLTIEEKYTIRVPKSVALTLAMNVEGQYADGSTLSNPDIIIEEREVAETFPLLPHVYFNQGSSDLARTHLRLMRSNQIQSFNISTLPKNAMAMYANNLNIVGYRMNQNPAINVTITGCNNNIGEEENNNALSTARAEAVRNYLRDVWGISDSRMTLKSRGLPAKPSSNDVADGQAENRRVELTTSFTQLLRPVNIATPERTATPPIVNINTDVSTESEITLVSTEVRQGNTILKAWEGNAPGTEEHAWVVLDTPSPSTEEPIEITTTVTDIHGQRREQTESLSVQQLTVQKKRSEIRNDRKVEIYSLILFDFGKSDLGPQNEEIMREVKAAIEPTSTVTIFGYADRTGNPDFNRRLAERRCNEVRKSLRGVPMDELIIQAVGSDELIYDNDVPEGRSYSRTVRIVIDTPVR